MKIKHWQGYGTVEAKRMRGKDFDLIVTVSGNHEWGLRRDDMYDLFNWLVKKFDKSVADMDWLEFRKLRPEVYIAEWEYDGIDRCQYKFRYHRN